jgi:hypothetical protein
MSKAITIVIPHELGRAEARRRIDEGVARLVGQVGAVGELTRTWEGDVLRFSLTALGQVVSGDMTIGDREVRLEVLLPGIFGMIAGKVKGRLRDEGRLLLSGPARR